MKSKIKVSIALVLSIAFLSYFFLDKTLAIYMANSSSDIKTIIGTFSPLGLSKYYLIGSFLIFLITYKYNQNISKAALYIFSSVALSGLIVILIKYIFARYRPPKYIHEQLFGFNWFDFGYIINSFPSGHSATAFSLFTALALLLPKYKWFFLIFATLVALSRVALGVHFLSDILVGSLIGAITSIYLYDKFYKAKV
jgi:membrane-associated phospholipid phosphatase